MLKRQLVVCESGAPLADRLAIASSFLERTKGLLGRTRLEPGEALAIERCSMVHMFFMRFPIDVIFCTQDWTVLAVVHNLKPWRVSCYVSGAYFAVEVPAGTAARAELKPGDALRVKVC